MGRKCEEMQRKKFMDEGVSWTHFSHPGAWTNARIACLVCKSFRTGSPFMKCDWLWNRFGNFGFSLRVGTFGFCISGPFAHVSKQWHSTVIPTSACFPWCRLQTLNMCVFRSLSESVSGFFRTNYFQRNFPFPSLHLKGFIVSVRSYRIFRSACPYIFACQKKL